MTSSGGKPSRQRMTPSARPAAHPQGRSRSGGGRALAEQSHRTPINTAAETGRSPNGAIARQSTQRRQQEIGPFLPPAQHGFLRLPHRAEIALPINQPIGRLFTAVLYRRALTGQSITQLASLHTGQLVWQTRVIAAMLMPPAGCTEVRHGSAAGSAVHRWAVTRPVRLRRTWSDGGRTARRGATCLPARSLPLPRPPAAAHAHKTGPIVQSAAHEVMAPETKHTATWTRNGFPTELPWVSAHEVWLV